MVSQIIMFTFDLDITSGFQVATYPAGATFGPRAMPDYELVWIIEGDVQYRFADTFTDAPQGSILLCKPGVTDFFRWDVRRRTRHGWFHFHLVGETPSEWGPPSQWPTLRIPQSESDLLPTLFRQLISAGPSQGDLPIPIATRLLAVSVLATFVAENIGQGSGVETPQYPDPVTRAMTFIATRLEEHPADPLPLDEIARVAFVTPEHLCRLFQAYTKHTPAATVRLLRLDRAAVLLARTNYSVGEIAALCGFPSQFHFARRFREAFGQSPTELRREVADGRGTVPTTRLVRIAANTDIYNKGNF